MILAREGKGWGPTWGPSKNDHHQLFLPSGINFQDFQPYKNVICNLMKFSSF